MINAVPYESTAETYLQCLQFRIIHRYFPCRYNLNLWNVVNDNKCEFCNDVDTLGHYFAMECDSVVQFWTFLKRWFIRTFQFVINFTSLDILLGIPNYDNSNDVSTSLFNRILKFEIGNEDQFTHLPQVFTIVTQILANDTDDPIVFITEERGRERQRFNWTDASVDKLANSDKIAMFYNCMEMGDIEDGAKTLVSFLHDITELKPCRIEKDTSRSQQPWWDNELDNARAIKHKCLRFLKKENSDFARSKYRITRNKFKAMVRLKKARYRKLLNRNWKIVHHLQSFGSL